MEKGSRRKKRKRKGVRKEVTYSGNERKVKKRKEGKGSRQQNKKQKEQKKKLVK